jgi:hypothetical protein
MALASLVLSPVGLQTSTLAAPWQSSHEQLPAPSTLTTGPAQSSAPQTPDDNSPQPATIARIRIPGDMLLETLERDFTLIIPVQRTILGTRSSGHAVCRGRVHGELLPAENAARLKCVIKGTVVAVARGVNGPAIINSQAVTHYRAHTQIIFDGEIFSAEPVQVHGATRLTITQVDSQLPRLRGRVVRRVAARRAQRSHAEAQAITCQLTVNDLQQQIDQEFRERMAELNRRFAGPLSALQLLERTDAALTISSKPRHLQIDLVTHAPQETTPQIPQLQSEPSAVELWLPIPPLAEPAVGIIALTTLPQLLGGLLEDRPRLAELLTEQLEFQRHGEWLIVVLQSRQTG